jgi:glycosyltransferase involved in cell wall biosynthesis
MKVLLSAYSCLPGDGSLAEPGIGWNWAQCIAANGHDLVVITRTDNQQKIEMFAESHSVERTRFVFHDLSRFWQQLYKLPFGNYVYYFLWQYTAAERALKLHRTEKFDRVQHITWGSFRVPSFMGRLNIPFTFGPVGGGEDTPKNLRRGLGWQGRLFDSLRRISTALMVPSMGFTYATAAEIVATTAETLAKIPAKYRHKARSQQAVGLDLDSILALSQKFHQEPTPRSSSRLELLYVGRLLPWKGLHLILRALAVLPGGNSNLHLTVIGSGKDLSRLQSLSRSLKVDGMISWVPWMPREELIRLYSQFDLFTFPSLHDSGGMVVLEALTFGLPVVCLDLGGPGVAVNDSCGRVIVTAGATEDHVVKAIAQFLTEVQVDRSLLRRLSAAARAHASTRTWQANVNSIYGGSLVTQPN